jgi:hypothetical protein
MEKRVKKACLRGRKPVLKLDIQPSLLKFFIGEACYRLRKRVWLVP